MTNHNRMIDIQDPVMIMRTRTLMLVGAFMVALVSHHHAGWHHVDGGSVA